MTNHNANHATCDHPATKVARAKCRRLNKTGAPTPTDAQRVVAVKNAFAEELDKLTTKQRDAAHDRLTDYDCDLGDDYPRVVVTMVNVARKGKCSISKLTDAKIAAIINA